MTKILFFIDTLTGGGAEKVLRTLVNHMDQVLDTVFELNHAAAAPLKEEPIPAVLPQVGVSKPGRASIRQ